MFPWFVRFLLVLVIALALLLGIEVVATLAEPRLGMPAWAWLPATLGTIGWVGWYVVRRLPLAWGGIVGGVLALGAAWLTFPIKLRLSGGPLAWPREVDIPLVATALIVMFLVGTVAGLAGGAVAHRRRRLRRRQAALEAIDSPMAGVIDPTRVRSDEADIVPRRRVRR
jgi:hypothetical protein